MAYARIFHWIDYVVFGASLAIGAIIGVYYGCFGKRQKTVEEFLMGNRKLGIVPVALSIQATYMSAIFILGGTAEVYAFGTMMFMLVLSDVISIPVTIFVLVPFIRHNPLAINAYQYFEARFNRPVRLSVSIAFALQTMVYMAIALFAPALGFSQVTGLSMWLSLFTTGAVCTFYTTLGGMKAVVWTDVFQMIVIFAGLIVLVIKGVIACGGFKNVIETADEGKRLEFWRHDLRPSSRHTIWTQTIGGAVMTLTVYCTQSVMQRLLATRTIQQAQLAVLVSKINTLITTFIIVLLGLVMYAYFAHCDPIKTHKVRRPDQVILLFVMEILGDYHGLPGLFTACIFAASLSTVSSGVNSLAAVVLEDAIKPLYSSRTKKCLTDSKATLISKFLAFLIGVVCICLGYAAGTFGRTVLQISLTVGSLLMSPVLALFIMGIFMPFINSKGALVGLIGSMLVTSWIAVGAILYSAPPKILKEDISACPATLFNHSSLRNGSSFFLSPVNYTLTPLSTTFSLPLNSTTGQLPSQASTFQSAYEISYMWYAPVAFIVCIVLASIVSIITGCNRKQPIDSQLLYFKQWNTCACAKNVKQPATSLSNYIEDEDVNVLRKESDV